VINGQVADQNTFNAAFASKQSDNTSTGKQTLARPASGATVNDVQQAINDVIASDALKIPLAQKGAANGVAELDGSSLVPVAQIPDLTASKITDFSSAANLALDTFATDNSSGSLVTLALPTVGTIELINAGLVSIEGITAPGYAKRFCLINKTGVDVTIKNESGTAANRIKTGTGADLTISNDQMFTMSYSTNSSRWFISGGSGGGPSELIKEIPSGTVDGVNDTFTFSDLAVDAASVWVFVDGVYILSGFTFTPGITQSSITFTSNIPVVGQTVEVHYFKSVTTPIQTSILVPSGSLASPNVITAAGGVTVTSSQRQYQFVESSGGAVTVTANPQVQAGSIVGQELILEGTSDTDYPTLNDGTGLALNGSVDLKNEKKIYLVWNGAKWSEISRT